MARLFSVSHIDTRTEEILLGDGRTLYGSASSIINSEGQTLGRVAVMRDITHLKELDAMKSEFVATVSHDLRAPLTYMRGYATMLPMVGPLSPKQQDYTEKVMAGIEQMTELIDDLLDLGRIEAGVGMVREACSLADIARTVVETMKPQALSRGLMLRTGKLSERMIAGDQGLAQTCVDQSSGQRDQVHAYWWIRHGVRGRTRHGDGHRGERHRHRHRTGRSGAPVRAFLPRQAARNRRYQGHRFGPGHCEIHRRVASRSRVGREPDRRRRHVLFPCAVWRHCGRGDDDCQGLNKVR